MNTRAKLAVVRARQQGVDVIAQDPDIGELPPFHLAQQGDHAVNERLGADQSDIGVAAACAAKCSPPPKPISSQ